MEALRRKTAEHFHGNVAVSCPVSKCTSHWHVPSYLTGNLARTVDSHQPFSEGLAVIVGWQVAGGTWEHNCKGYCMVSATVSAHRNVKAKGISFPVRAVCTEYREKLPIV